MQGGADCKDTCGPSNGTACRLPDDTRDGPSRDRERAGSGRQDQEQLSMSPGMNTGAAAAAAADAAAGKQAAGKAAAAADAHNSSRDHQQPRDVALVPIAAPAAPGSSAFAALAGSYPVEYGTSAGSDAGAFMRQPRGVEAMMGGQRRTHSGALTSPSGLSDHGSLLVERAASSSSAHRALLGGSSPNSASAAAAAAAAAATAAALLELPDGDTLMADGSTDAEAQAADMAPCGDAVAAAQQQQQQPGDDADLAAGGPFNSNRRAAGITRPTVVIPSPDPASYFAGPMVSPASGGLLHTFPGSAIPIDELDLDVIDGTPSADACGLSTSSSPTIGGAGMGRSAAAAGHLRGSRDHDLRRVAVMNHMLSPSMQPISISAEGGGGAPAMFTGPTRGRALPGSNNSLHLAGSGAGGGGGGGGGEQYSSTESSADTRELLQTLRLSRGSTPSPSPYNGGSPARPRSALGASATPRTTPGFGPAGSRASSATASPVPPPSHGQAAALLAWSVVASPRTPHSPLSVLLSPRPNSTLALSAQGTPLPLPGPLFGSGFNIGGAPGGGGNGAAGAGGLSPGTSPGTSSVAAPSSTASSCCTNSGTGLPTHPTAAGRGSVLGMPGAAGPPAGSRLAPPSSPTPGVGACDGEAAGHPTHSQLLRQQLMQHDTRLGPHGGSPLSPSHHHHQQQLLPPRATDGLLSPTCPTPLVPPALTSAGSHDRQPADGAVAGLASAPAGAGPAGRPAGGVGHQTVHDWLDLQSWRLPLEVPAGLRDAADVREAAAHEQQQHSRMGPAGGSRGPGSSRAGSQRNSISNLDSPGALLQAPGHFGAFSGRLPSGAGAGLNPVPPPALHGGQHLHAGVVSSPQQHHQQHHYQQQQVDVLLHRRLAAIHAAQAAAAQEQQQQLQGHQGVGGPGVPAAGYGDSCLSVAMSGPLGSDSSSSMRAAAPAGLQHIPLRPASAGDAAPAAASAPLPGLGFDWQQQQQQQQQAVATGHGSSAQRPAGLSPLGQYPWGPSTGQQLPFGGGALQHSTDGAGLPGAGGAAAAVAEADALHAGHMLPHQHPGRGDVSCNCNSSSSGAGLSSSVVQLGAGSHLYPAGSPVDHGSCCYSCQQHGHGRTCPGMHAATGTAAGPPAHRSSSSSGDSLASGSAHISRPAAGRTLSAALQDPPRAQQQQQQHLQAVAAVWRQLQHSPLPQGGHCAAGADAPGHTSPLLARCDQDVLPGVAELLRLPRSPHPQQQHYSSSSRAQPAAASTTSCEIPGGMGSAAVAAGAAAAVRSSDSATHAHSCRGSDGAAAKRCRTAAPVPDDLPVSTGGQPGACSNSGGGDSNSSGRDSNIGRDSSPESVGPATLAEALRDRCFICRVVSALPGVDPQAGVVWEAVAELQEALREQQQQQPVAEEATQHHGRLR